MNHWFSKKVIFFQPQCVLCEQFSGQVCFDYKGGTLYGIASGSVNVTRLITNLPYIYSLGENVGAFYTTVYSIGVLREDLVISYRTLSRFKVKIVEKKKNLFIKYFHRVLKPWIQL